MTNQEALDQTVFSGQLTGEREADQEFVLNNKADFDSLLAGEELSLEALQTAEDFLKRVKAKQENFSIRDYEIRVMEMRVFNKYLMAEDWESAQRIAQSSVVETDKEARLKRLEEVKNQKAGQK